jgi:hypothetical protein
MLLAQPTSRHKLWWEKMRVLAVALGVSSLVWLVCVGILAYGGALTIPLRIDDQLMIVAVLAMPLVIWCSAPYHTMAGRGTLLGTMFTLMVPMGVLG